MPNITQHPLNRMRNWKDEKDFTKLMEFAVKYWKNSEDNKDVEMEYGYIDWVELSKLATEWVERGRPEGDFQNEYLKFTYNKFTFHNEFDHEHYSDNELILQNLHMNTHFRQCCWVMSNHHNVHVFRERVKES